MIRLKETIHIPLNSALREILAAYIRLEHIFWAFYLAIHRVFHIVGVPTAVLRTNVQGVSLKRKEQLTLH